MYKKSDFTSDVDKKLALVLKKLESKSWDSNKDTFLKSIEEIKETINNIAVTELGYSEKLEYKINYKVLPTAIVGDIGDEIRTAFIVSFGTGMYSDLVEYILKYYESIEKSSKLQRNLNEFNIVIAELMLENAVQTVKNRLENQLEEEEVDFDSIECKTSLSFGLGKDFLDISELSVIIGLSEEVIMDMASWGIFETESESRMKASRDKVASLLDIYVQPYGFIKVNDVFTKENYLNTYTRENLSTVMRRSFNTPLDKLRVGLGYYETKGDLGIFSIIEKKAINEANMKEATEDLIYIDNLDMTEEEAKNGLNMIEIGFRIFPFYKDGDEPANETLTEIWTAVNN